MKKVLIVTYYWPPSGGSGVQRWLKFVKYLRQFGWEPIIYTPLDPEGALQDESLLKDVPENITILKTKIWEPYGLYKKVVGQKKNEKINVGFLTEKKKPGLIQKTAIWIRSNVFIPDARKYWIKPSVKFLRHYLSEHKIDALVTTGPPHSMHLIGLRLKQQLNIPWLADFRDPWTNIDYYKDLKLTRRSDAKHKNLEKSVLQQATRVLTIGQTLADELAQLGGRKVDVITNGYDEDDFALTNPTLDKQFTISHIGAMNADRNPKVLWKVLSELVKENKEFEKKLVLKLIGKLDYSVHVSLEENNLTRFVEQIEYVPHQQATAFMYSSQLLLLALNNTPNAQGIVSGKVFEYIAAKRPILAIGAENGDAAKILTDTGAGKICGFDNAQQMKTVVLTYFDSYLKGQNSINVSASAQFSRRALTKSLAQLLDEMV